MAEMVMRWPTGDHWTDEAIRGLNGQPIKINLGEDQVEGTILKAARDNGSFFTYGYDDNALILRIEI
jgi:hypothetical protein